MLEGAGRSKRQRRPPAWLQDDQAYATASNTVSRAAAATAQVGPPTAAASLANNNIPQGWQGQGPGAATQQQMPEQETDEYSQQLHLQRLEPQLASVPENQADHLKLQASVCQSTTPALAGAADHQALEAQHWRPHQTQRNWREQRQLPQRGSLQPASSTPSAAATVEHKHLPAAAAASAVTAEASGCATAAADIFAHNVAGGVAAAEQQGQEGQHQQLQHPLQQFNSSSAEGGSDRFLAPSWLKLLSCEVHDEGQALAVRLELAGTVYSGRLTQKPVQHQEQLLQDEKGTHQVARCSQMAVTAQQHQQSKVALDPLPGAVMPSVAAAAASDTLREPGSGTAQLLRSPELAAALGLPIADARHQAPPAPINSVHLVNALSGSRIQRRQLQQPGAGSAEALLGRTAEAVRQERLQHQEEVNIVRATGTDTSVPPGGLQQHNSQLEQGLGASEPSASKKLGGSVKPQPSAGRDTIGMLSAFALQQEFQEQAQQQKQSVNIGLHSEVVIARTKARKRPTAQP